MFTHAGRCSAHPSTTVVPVASCQRAMPSVSTNLKNAPRATPHNSTTPYLAPPTVADTTSPDPMPAAATIRPGPASLSRLKDGAGSTISVRAGVTAQSLARRSQKTKLSCVHVYAGSTRWVVIYGNASLSRNRPGRRRAPDRGGRRDDGAHRARCREDGRSRRHRGEVLAPLARPLGAGTRTGWPLPGSLVREGQHRLARAGRRTRQF